MFQIQTLNNIAQVGLKQFPQPLYQISNDTANPDAILVRSSDMHQMSFDPSLKVVGRAGAGVNNIPVAKLTELGIPVLNTIGANANAVRELVLAGMLLASRNIFQACSYIYSLENISNEIIEENKKRFVGFELMGKTLGVVGLGSVGVKVANAAMHLGMQVIGYDPTITVDRAWELSSGVKQAKTLENLLTECDFVTLHVPLTDATKHMMNATRLSLMKTGAVLLNFSRDGIIDNTALLDALNQNKIFCYVNDFPNQQFKQHARIISLPHLGASTKEAEENCAVMIVKQIREYLENGNIINAVNFPTIEMPRHGEGSRMAIVNKNIPNIVGQISTKLGNAGMNILSLTNGSKDDIAYTLIDVNAAISETLLKEIAAVQGVVRAGTIAPMSPRGNANSGCA